MESRFAAGETLDPYMSTGEPLGGLSVIRHETTAHGPEPIKNRFWNPQFHGPCAACGNAPRFPVPGLGPFHNRI